MRTRQLPLAEARPGSRTRKGTRTSRAAPSATRSGSRWPSRRPWPSAPRPGGAADRDRRLLRAKLLDGLVNQADFFELRALQHPVGFRSITPSTTCSAAFAITRSAWLRCFRAASIFWRPGRVDPRRLTSTSSRRALGDVAFRLSSRSRINFGNLGVEDAAGDRVHAGRVVARAELGRHADVAVGVVLRDRPSLRTYRWRFGRGAIRSVHFGQRTRLVSEYFWLMLALTRRLVRLVVWTASHSSSGMSCVQLPRGQVSGSSRSRSGWSARSSRTRRLRPM